HDDQPPEGATDGGTGRDGAGAEHRHRNDRGAGGGSAAGGGPVCGRGGAGHSQLCADGAEDPSGRARPLRRFHRRIVQPGLLHGRGCPGKGSGKMNWLIENGTFLTQDPERPVVRGWLAVRGDRIAGLGEGEAPQDVRSVARERVDGKDLLFLPGLVNTHGHAAMTLLRGYADDLKLQEWLNHYIWPMEARLTDDDVYWGTLLAAAEMIRTGTTAFADMYFFMDRAAEAVETSGMRASLCRGI